MSRRTLVILVFSVLCILTAQGVSASDTIYIVDISANDPTQGDLVILSVAVPNLYDDTILIDAVFVHFAWQDGGLGYYAEGTPAYITIGGTESFTLMASVPLDTQTGTRSVDVVIDYIYWDDWGYEVSDTGDHSTTIYVYPAQQTTPEPTPDPTPPPPQDNDPYIDPSEDEGSETCFTVFLMPAVLVCSVAVVWKRRK